MENRLPVTDKYDAERSALDKSGRFGGSDMTPIPWRCSDICKALKLSLNDKSETLFASISTDSRFITRDDLFVALRGERFNGHSFIFDLISLGIRGFVVEKAFSDTLASEQQKKIQEHDILLFSVDDTLSALGMLARFQRVRSNVKVLAITGSNGKTTTRRMAASIFGQHFNTLSTQGNLNNEIGLPMTLLKLSSGHQWAVVEMGMNHPGEIARLSAIARPDIAIVTNTTDAHLEGLGTVDDVARAKAEITEGMTPGSTILINRDDPRWHIIANRAKEFPDIANTLFWGADRESSHFSAADLSFDQEGITFSLCRNSFEALTEQNHQPGDQLKTDSDNNRTSHEGMDHCCECNGDFRIRTPARFMLCNALAAIAAAFTAGIPHGAIQKGLLMFEPTAGRMKIIELGHYGTDHKLYLIDDTYNANPGSVKGAVETLKRLSLGRESIAILGDMLELGEQSRKLHFQIGQAVAMADVSRLYLHGDMASEFALGAQSSGLSQERIMHGTKEEIIADLMGYMQKGEQQKSDIWILVKGSRGMKMEKIVEALISCNGEDLTH